MFLAKVLSFVNHKGGVGKTTSCVSVAGILSLKHKKKVLAVDFDPQGNLTKSVGISPEELEISMIDVLKDEALFSDVILNTSSGFFVAPSNLDLALAEFFLIEKIGREFVLKEKLVSVLDKFDIILIDCPPSLGILTVNALCASTDVLVPVETSFFSLEGFASILERMKTVKKKLNPDLRLLGVLATKFDQRKNIHKESLYEIKESIPSKVFNSVIKTNVKLEEASREGKTIYEYAKDFARDYEDLTLEILERLGLENA